MQKFAVGKNPNSRNGFKKGVGPTFERTAAYRAKLAAAGRGRVVTDETRKKLSEALKGRPSPFKGLRHTADAISRIRETNRRAKPPGYKLPDWHRQLIVATTARGANHYEWKGGVSRDPAHKLFLNRRRDVRKRGNGGTHTRQEWEHLKRRYNATCPACGRVEPEIRLTEDHIVPLHLGGSDDITNIQPLCRTCNSRKHLKKTRYAPII